MSPRNTAKADIVLKNFWKDNAHFADLFNAVLFDGEQKLHPEDLREADVDLSSVLKFNGHIETIQRLRDVVKKTAYGMDFVIWGIENQQKIHYAMPLRHMIEDALSYLKEYNEIAKKNLDEKTTNTKDEFLSRFKKTDRLHPVITLCIYYGEKEWDGATSLKEILELPDYLENLVPDYKMNLLQLRNSENLKFKNKDVQTIFDVSRLIYGKNYGKITSIYKDQNLTNELGIVIGAITGSQELINYAASEKEGGQFNMCTALDELIESGKEKLLTEMVEKKLAKNKTPDTIADELETDISIINNIIEKIEKCIISTLWLFYPLHRVINEKSHFLKKILYKTTA